ncbi:hypothetical protein BD769DRAFT_1556556 [Suillus cothurnatus]|nr:hypothetical protein BD769DRAFT_1556556 [Suillus cothurnatus]
MSHPVCGAESLAVIYSLLCALFMWSMVLFVVAFAFACMVFCSVMQSAFGATGGLVCIVVFWMVRTTRTASE